MPATDEKGLLQKLRGGDAAAFTELYNRYKKRLAAKLIRLLKSDELARDTLQEIFANIWERREQIDPEQPFAAYLFRIAVNMVSNIYRKSYRDESMKQQLMIASPGAFASPETQYIAKERFRQLNDALEKLPERQRQVYILHKIDGKSYKEIEEELHISRSAINNHITRANHTLQILLRADSIAVTVLVATALLVS